MCTLQVSHDEASNMVTTVEGQLEEMRAFLADYQPITSLTLGASGTVPPSPQASPAKPLSRLPSGIPQSPQQQQHQGAAGKDSKVVAAAPQQGEAKAASQPDDGSAGGVTGASVSAGDPETGLDKEEEEGECAAVTEAASRGQDKLYVGTRWVEALGKWQAVTVEVIGGQRKER